MIRKRRIDELRYMQSKKSEWLAKGHGEYRLCLNEKDFFQEMKGEERMVAHFFRESNMPCKVRKFIFLMALVLCPFF